MFGYCRQLGALHKIESEDVITTIMQYDSTARPGDRSVDRVLGRDTPERLEIHGTQGTASSPATSHHVGRHDDTGEAAAGGPRRRLRGLRSDGDFACPVRTPVLRFRRRLHTGRQPLIAGEEGYRRWSCHSAANSHARDGRRSPGRATDPECTALGPSPRIERQPGTRIRRAGTGAPSLYLECRYRPSSELRIRVTGRDAAMIPTTREPDLADVATRRLRRPAGDPPDRRSPKRNPALGSTQRR